MSNPITLLFSGSGFEPHGTHFAEYPGLFWSLVVANLLTFVAYTLIPIVLVYFVRKRRDIVFPRIFLLFGAFIILCGLHHLVHVITFWNPIYRFQAAVDMLMSVVSIGTFFSLIPIMPLAIKLQSPEVLAKANELLTKEVESRKQAEEMLRANEKVLREKNQELENVNRLMIGRELKMTEMKEELDRIKSRSV